MRIISEVVSPGVYGQARLTWGWIDLVFGIVFSPFCNYATRAFPEAKIKGWQNFFNRFCRRTTLDLTLLVGLPFLAGLWIYQRAENQVDFLVLFLAVIYLGLMSFWSLERSLLLADRWQGRLSLMAIAETWGYPLGILAAVFLLGDRCSSFFIGWAGFQLVGLSVFYKWGAPRYPREEGPAPAGTLTTWRGDAWRFALPMIPVGLILWLVRNSSRYLLDWFESPEKVGVFVACYGLASQPFTIMGGILARFFRPIWYTAIEQGRLRRVRFIMVLYFCLAALISGAGVILLKMFGPPIVQLILAEPYRSGALDILLWVAAAHGVLATAGVFEIGLYADKRTGTHTTVSGLAAAANLVLSWILIQDRGMIGAAQATCWTYCIYLFLLAAFYFLGKPSRSGLLTSGDA